jgi:hypothetical protein
MWKSRYDKAFFPAEGDAVPCFLAARGGGGEGREYNTHIHGEEAKGKETLIKYFASSASWNGTTTRVGCRKGSPLLPWSHEPTSPHDREFYDVAPGFHGDLYSL